MEYPNYVEMKDSGIEWLGEIPEHWENIRFKYIARLINGYSFNSKDYVEDGVPVIRIGDIGKNVDWESTKYIPENLAENLERFLIQNNDILIALTGATVGKSAIFEENKVALLNQRVGLVRSNEINQKFLYFFIKSNMFNRYVRFSCYGGAQENIGKEELNDLFISVPPVEEQQAIADFLDQETDRINKLIDKKERLIELLEEKRQAMISETVTKGLDPDVEMKDSGVEWLGKIPEHWSKVKGRYVLKIVNGYSPQEISMINDGFDYFKVDDLNQAGDGFFLNGSKKKIKGEKNKLIKPQIILIPKRGEAIYTNKVRIAKNECSFDTNIMGLKSKEKNEIEYLGYVLKTRKLDDVADVSSIPQINNKHINNLYIPIPPFDEQKNIIDYIKNKTKKLDSLINKIKAQISNLKEYRKTLITKAVTGKIDVIDLAE